MCSVIYGATLKYSPKFLDFSFIHLVSEGVSVAVLLLLLLLYYLLNWPCARWFGFEMVFLSERSGKYKPFFLCMFGFLPKILFSRNSLLQNVGRYLLKEKPFFFAVSLLYVDQLI